MRQLMHANSNCKMLCFWGVADLLGNSIECLHMISSHACSWCRSDCLVQLGPSSLDAILFGLDQPLYLSLLIFICCTSLLFSSGSPFQFFLFSWLFLTCASKSVCLQFHSVCMTESSASVDKSQCNTNRCDFIWPEIRIPESSRSPLMSVAYMLPFFHWRFMFFHVWQLSVETCTWQHRSL